MRIRTSTNAKETWHRWHLTSHPRALPLHTCQASSRSETTVEQAQGDKRDAVVESYNVLPYFVHSGVATTEHRMVWRRRILITGATGRQGRAVIDALLSNPSDPPFEILALTRNPHSPNARALDARPGVRLVEGDFSKPEPIFKAENPIHGIFCYTIPGKEEGDEERQAKPLIDAAIANNVSHFIFSSVDRGGPGWSEENPTQVPHFASKHKIEIYLRGKAAIYAKDMHWTILRPVCFMDNLTQDFKGRGFASMWASLPPDVPIQLISIRDIGLFAARAFNDEEEYSGWTITLAGDDLTFAEGKQIFKLTVGHDMPETFEFYGPMKRRMSKEAGPMFKYFETDGFGGDIEGLREEEPRLQDFAAWLRESSGFLDSTYLSDWERMTPTAQAFANQLASRPNFGAVKNRESIAMTPTAQAFANQLPSNIRRESFGLFKPGQQVTLTPTGQAFANIHWS